MFARLFRKPQPQARNRRAARLGVECLEDRSVPAIINLPAVNTVNDTHAVTDVLGNLTPHDVNNQYSLRSLIEFANANPQNGAWNANHYNVDLSQMASQTITLSATVGFRTLTLNTNFNFLANAGNVTISRPTAAGTPDYNHFDVSAGTESHWAGITLRDGSSTFDGGSIWNNGKVEFTNCTFTMNSTTRSGGAIATNSGAMTTVNGCEFSWNSATGNLGVGGGGAIAALSGSLTLNILGSTLTENDTEGNGGAVWAHGVGTLLIDGSSITVNRALGNGSSFGGGVYVDSVTTATINQSNITINTSWHRGGGLYVKDCNLTMTGGQLAENDSTDNGGGFFVDANNKTVTLDQVSVTDNHSGWKGGGGFIVNGTLALQLNAGQLKGNRADGIGLNGSLPGIGVGVGAFWTGTVAPRQQKVELDQL